jgi:hypothetical protein
MDTRPMHNPNPPGAHAYPSMDKFLGNFATIDEAITARKAAQARYGYHANHGRGAEG